MIPSKFNVGDTVYAATIRHTERRVECPDCLGKKVWPIQTPAGEALELSCPTCSWGFEHHGWVTVYDWEARVIKSKVTGVWIDSTYPNDRKVGYRVGECIYDETRLFIAEEEACECAEKLLIERREYEAKQNEQNRERTKKEARRLYKSYHIDELRNACLKHKANEVYRELTGYDLGERMRAPSKRTRSSAGTSDASA